MPLEIEVFNTQRLLLRKLTPAVYNYLFEQCPEAAIRRELGLLTDEAYAKERGRYEGGYQTYNRSLVQFQLFLQETGELIGSCGFHNWFPEHSRAELGYALLRDEHKRLGFMTEAVDLALKYGFGTMKLNRVEACIGPDNEASLTLIKKFGFTQEGYLRQHYFKEGILYDSLIFALLKDEYAAMKQ